MEKNFSFIVFINFLFGLVWKTYANIICREEATTEMANTHLRADNI